MSNNQKGTNTSKDVIYIDVDDEITGIIDKVQGSSKKIVALVLPKRATVLQSVVNMKLLKRAATEAKKNLVLITSESSLMPLAGTVGIHVAKNLSSKPEVPEGPEQFSAASSKLETIDEADDEGAAIRLDGSKTVGELSGVSIPIRGGDHDEAEEAIELDDEQGDGQDMADESVGEKVKDKGKKKFKIPNFHKFRLGLVLVVVGVLVLGVLGYVAFAVMPKAKVTIKTNSEAASSNVVLNLKTAADTALDVDGAVIRAQAQEVKKTATQQVPATGQQNNGDKATGSITMTAKNCSTTSSPSDVSAGTGVTAGGKTYITQKKANFGFDSFSGGCIYFKTGAVPISAQNAGAQFNVDSANFTVAGRSDVTATGSASGGTDNILKVVTQDDVDNAKQKITEQDTQPIIQELKSALIGRKLYAMDSTFGAGEPETKLSAEVNSPADTVTVTQTTTYTMYGVNQGDLEKIITKSVADKIDTKRQNISNYGLDNASFTIQGVNGEGATVAMQTTVVAGPELDANTIKKQVAGKKAGDVKNILSANPGVTDVQVEYSPFWVGSVPEKTGKITVVIQEPKVANEQSSP